MDVNWFMLEYLDMNYETNQTVLSNYSMPNANEAQRRNMGGGIVMQLLYTGEAVYVSNQE